MVKRFLEVWELGKYDLLFMDYLMPGLDGIETWIKVKSMAQEVELPKIIMVTAYGKEEVVKEATEAGIQSILMKPVTHSTLFDTLIQTVSNDEWGASKESKRELNLLSNVSDLKGLSILLVEDNLINQQVASENLVSLGIDIDIANHGEEAVKKSIELRE